MRIQADRLKPGKRIEAFDCKAAIESIKKAQSKFLANWKRFEPKTAKLTLRDLARKGDNENSFFTYSALKVGTLELAHYYNDVTYDLQIALAWAIQDGLLPPWHKESTSFMKDVAYANIKDASSIFKKLHPLQVQEKMDLAYTLGDKIVWAGGGPDKRIVPGNYMSIKAFEEWHKAVQKTFEQFCEKVIKKVKTVGENLLSYLQKKALSLGSPDEHPPKLVVRSSMRESVVARYLGDKPR